MKGDYYDWPHVTFHIVLSLAVIALAIGVSVWQNNPRYLWLLALLILTL